MRWTAVLHGMGIGVAHVRIESWSEMARWVIPAQAARNGSLSAGVEPSEKVRMGMQITGAWASPHLRMWMLWDILLYYKSRENCK